MAITAKLQYKGVVIDEVYVNVDLFNLQKVEGRHEQNFCVNIFLPQEPEPVLKLSKSITIDTAQASYKQVYDAVKAMGMFTNIQDV